MAVISPPTSADTAVTPVAALLARDGSVTWSVAKLDVEGAQEVPPEFVAEARKK